MTRQIDSTDGVRLPLHDLGGAGEPLLVAHATGFHGRAYAPLARRLCDFHVWAPDLRGHGDATPPAQLDYRWEGFADDVEAALDALAPTQPIFGFGHSMGATALLLVEARRPGAFRGLWLFEPIVWPPGIEPEPDRARRFEEGTRKRRRHFDSVDAAIDNYRGKRPFHRMSEEGLSAYVEHGFRPSEDGSIELKMDPDHEARVYAMNRSHPAWEILPAVGCPVTVAAGAPEPGPGLWARQVADRVPGARFAAFESLTHMAPFEDPSCLAEDLKRFAEALG